MIEKNKEYELDIIAQGYEGEGISKTSEGFTIFIPEALKGEKVRVKIVKSKKSYAYGKLIEILKPSKNREIPICPIYKRCGGCSLQHTSYNSQLEFKTERVKDCMSKIAKINPDIVKPAIGMKNPYRYRNKVQLPVGSNNGELQIGFFAPRSHDIIDMKSCYIQDEVADKAVDIIRKWILKNNIKPYIVDGQYSPEGVLRHIMVRKGFKTNEVMVVLVTTTEKLPHKEELILELAQSIPEIKSIMLNINTKPTNVILGEKSLVLYGKDHISDYIGNFKFNISPLSFFQVNPVQTEILYAKALEFAELTGNETVFDAYCGTGTISLFLSQKAKRVYGVEIVPQAIENAIHNAKENNVKNAEFHVGEAEKIIPEMISQGIKAEVVVVDPPRKGCEKALLEAIAKMSPERIVYVSCDPSTLARDLAILEEMNYETKEVQSVDMFPQTAHIENVALITRK
ncbi:23S rRNA m(5)U-1939 methyltransferase [Clostridium amylolyticum]|uniref:23S rRNA m(5)U-1939 methyltransferase n=1 Tax=Clostridium amylolyticum TaxID=1121298 RepID=A0A1M6H3B0_9CLOT|nr:23S rRNA (uracil(1939)-C(5))-methyltransferase RlmD [Clostridium amylolyticum]SHJ16674.1 23S rRNA m(5)U-1939 methyltransferase [Clostridium amylolyticum]